MMRKMKNTQHIDGASRNKKKASEKKFVRCVLFFFSANDDNLTFGSLQIANDFI